MKIRLHNLDILKSIGIFCIILAHVNPPKILFQIRNFDVILMAMISIYLYFYLENKLSIKDYLSKRFSRLVLPTWFFLIVLFSLNYIFNFNDWNIKIIFSSFLLNDGIGYVWIIRIYLLVALLLPIFDYLQKLIKVKYIHLISILLYLIYEILCTVGIFNNSIIQYIFAYIIPCFLIINITYFIMNSNNNKLTILTIAFMLLTIISAVSIYYITGDFKQTQFMKYPFRFYYLEYALFVSCLLILIFRHKKIVDFCYNNFIEFISKHSLWIYLWHILFINLLHFDFWLYKYISILILSIITVYIQNLIINHIKKKNINNWILNIFEG